jgi:hypothetical protein
MPDPDLKAKDLADRLADPAFRAQIEEAVARLPPDKAEQLVAMLEHSLHRRKVELIGYVAAVVVLLLGMVVALYAYGARGGGMSGAWIFLVPLALAGVVMMVVGRIARGHAPPPTPPAS